MNHGLSTINARSESVLSSSMYRRLVATQRCVVVSEGYFEWYTTEDGKKKPYFISLPDKQIMVIAGLYDKWVDKSNGCEVFSHTILTASPPRDIAFIHNRMPFILSPEHIPIWLGTTETTTEKIQSLLQQPFRGQLIYHEVDEKVGNVRNDGPDLIAPFDPKKKTVAGGMKVGAFHRFLTPKRAAPDSQPDEGKKQKQTKTITIS
eukprot:c8846_g1_i2.p1 GENE.c8846_g1_i2~~c8846_g1_i2.p1  ORF type:complete len:205 (+),score=31.80 c8846_g1_i2:97-711(+)